jgi:protein tyrosine phosphatase (PTP) superfamily phosphohydrolase (DUF442 family)
MRLKCRAADQISLRQERNEMTTKFFNKRRSQAIIALSLALGATGALLVCVYHVHFNYRFGTVEEGKLYHSAAMPPGVLVKRCQKLGIQTVIDLRHQPQAVAREQKALAQAGVRHVNIPSHQVPSSRNVDKFLQIMDDPLNMPVLIHCEHGEGRAVLFSALYRIEYEQWTNEQARQSTRWIFWGSDFARNGDKGGFLLSYTPRPNRFVQNAASYRAEVRAPSAIPSVFKPYAGTLQSR